MIIIKSSVLNADWHHGDGHARTAQRAAQARSAQRRLASRGRAPILRWAEGLPVKRCSTPIGITGTGTVGSWAYGTFVVRAQRRLASRGRAP